MRMNHLKNGYTQYLIKALFLFISIITITLIAGNTSEAKTIYAARIIGDNKTFGQFAASDLPKDLAPGKHVRVTGATLTATINTNPISTITHKDNWDNKKATFEFYDVPWDTNSFATTGVATLSMTLTYDKMELVNCNHNTKTTAATCTSGGSTTTSCSYPHAPTTRVTQSTTAALGHNYSKTKTKATCTATGTKECSRDSSHTTPYGPLGHNWSITTYATCEGTGTQTCSRDTSHTQSYGPLGHNYWPQTPTVTCLNGCVQTCLNDSSHTITTPALSHNDYNTGSNDPNYNLAAAATCLTPAHYYNLCTNGCNANQFNTTHPYNGVGAAAPYGERLGHDWDNGVVIKKSDVNNMGLIRFTCRRDSSHIANKNKPKDLWNIFSHDKRIVKVYYGDRLLKNAYHNSKVHTKESEEVVPKPPD